MTITIDGSQVVQLIEQLERRLSMDGPLGREIAGIMREDVRDQFQAGGNPPWPALNPDTVRAKARMGYPRLNRKGMVPASMVQRGGFGPQNILMRTGALFSSWTQEQDPHHFEKAGSNSVEIGSELPYAKHHQRGGRRLPQRAVHVTEAAKEKAAALVSKAMENN